MRRILIALIAILAATACAPSTVNKGTVSAGTSGTGSVEAVASKAPATPPTWGQKYTWATGIAIDVSAPANCKPGKYSMPQGAKRAAKFNITITNGSQKAYETTLLTAGVDAQFAGRKAEVVFDSSGPCGGGGMDSTTILPGKTYSYSVAIAVDPNPGELQLTFQADFGDDKAVFVGQA